MTVSRENTCFLFACVSQSDVSSMRAGTVYFAHCCVLAQELPSTLIVRMNEGRNIQTSCSFDKIFTFMYITLCKSLPSGGRRIRDDFHFVL